MKKLCVCLLITLMLFACAAAAEETTIQLGETIRINGAVITEDPAAPVYLARKNETHSDVPGELLGIENRMVTITAGGVYRISGTGTDLQIAVQADADADVRLILDGADITCRTSSAIAVFSARDPRAAGEYAVTIELAPGSQNRITGSHTVAMSETDIKLDGAICSLVSLGIEGSGSLWVDADNEGIEVKFGHITINGGVLDIQSGDDPLNVSEDGVGVLTMNDGYVFSAVKNAPGGEGDGIDSNGWIIFNGGTAINLAHPTSQDGGIDSDMGSRINGGVIVGAGNMYDPIEADSQQLFMMLEFAESTDDLLVVTDHAGNPVFAYDFPYDYMYIAFSTPQLQAGETYHVYLGGEIEGEEKNGLYTTITSYRPGRKMVHGAGNAARRAPADMGPQENFDPMQDRGPAPGNGNRPDVPMDTRNPWMDAAASLAALDLNEILKDADLNELLQDVDLNDLLTGVSITELLSEEQIRQYLGDVDPAALDMAAQMNRGFGGFGGFGGDMRGLSSSAEVATADFILTRETTGFTNVSAAADGN